MAVTSTDTSHKFSTSAGQVALDVSTEIGHDFQRFETEKGSLLSVAADSVGAVFTSGLPDWSQPERIQLIFADALEPHPLNPRKLTSREELVTLAESIRDSGLRKPLDICQKDAVTPEKALILSGHRRYWTTNSLECGLIPCRLDPRGVLTEVEQREALIRYNEGQEKPAPIDRAQSILDLMVVSGLNQAKTAARLSVTPATVSRLLKLLSLPEPVQELINKGDLNESVGFELTRIKNNPERQIDLALEAKERGYSAAKVRRMAGRPKVKLTSRSGKARVQPETQERTITVGDTGARITFRSNKTAVTDEVVADAVQELVGRIPVDLSVTTDEGVAKSFSEPASVQYGDVHEPGKGALVAGESEPLVVTPALPEELPADAATVGEREEASLATDDAPATLADPFGLAEPTVYEFPTVSGHRSGAAASVKAVFIDGYPDWSRTDEVQLVFRSALVPHPWNPRKAVSTESMRETVLAIKQSGIHSPLEISKHPGSDQKAFILGGHRRTWVSHKLDLELVPVKLDSRGVLSELQVRERLVNDNEGQVKPAPIDRARSFAEFKQLAGIEDKEAARRVNVSEAVFRKAVDLLRLPDPVQRMINNGDLSEGVGTALLGHRGGSDAIVAMAHTILEKGIPIGTVQRMVRRSQVNLGGLAVGDSKKTNEMHSMVGGNRRVHVVISAAEGSVPEGEALAELLRSSVGKLGTDADVTGKPEATPTHVSTAAAAVPIKDLKLKDSAVFAEGLKAFMPEVLTTRDNEAVVHPDFAAVLELRFSNDELKKLGFSSEDITVHSIKRWQGVSVRFVGDESVSVAETLEYLISCHHALKTLPPSKQELLASDVERLHLDTGHYHGGKRAVIEKEYKDRLDKVAEIVEVRLYPLASLDGIESSVKAVPNADMQFAIETLEEAGVTISSNFNWYYRRWLADTRRIEFSGTVEDRGYRFDDLHSYLTHCARTVLFTTGGRAERNIGKKQLRESNVVFSQMVGTTAPERYNAREVFEEIRSSLESLNRLFSEGNE